MKRCLIELDKVTQIESSLGNDHNRPYVLHMHSTELFALFLLITHRDHYSSSSTYMFNNSILSINDFPSYAHLHFIK